LKLSNIVQSFWIIVPNFCPSLLHFEESVTNSPSFDMKNSKKLGATRQMLQHNLMKNEQPAGSTYLECKAAAGPQQLLINFIRNSMEFQWNFRNSHKDKEVFNRIIYP
jgi:hypothetical protein